MSRYATIDLGTNTALLLVAELSGSTLTVLADRAEITRLGRGVDRTGHLDPEAARASLAVLREYVALAKNLGAEKIAAVGTASLRDAKDGASFLEEAKAILGVPLEVISGDEEARLAALAVARAFPKESGERVVFDIGGGSTELILLEREEIRGRHSYPIGSVKLTERHIATDPPHEEELSTLLSAAREAFATLPFAPPAISSPEALVGTAGTVTTLCAIDRQISPYDPAKIHGATLSADAVREIFWRLARLPLEARKKTVGLEPGRADVILAGAAIFLAILERLSAPLAIVSDHGLRHGLLWDRFGA